MKETLNIKSKKENDAVVEQPVSLEQHLENIKNIPKDKYKEYMNSIGGLSDSDKKSIDELANRIYGE